MINFIIAFLVGVFVFIVAFYVGKFLKVYTAEIVIKNSYLTEKLVDNIVEKAVIIAEYEIEKTEKVQERKLSKKYELACNIIADVLLQHGIQPKEYNIPAMVTVQRHKLNFIEKKEVK